MAYQTKTKPTEVSVETFLEGVEPAQRREDGRILAALMHEISGEPARMWGPTIIGFGSYDYRYDSGHQGTMCRMGFSPRKAELVLYLAKSDDREALLSRLGKHSTGKSCLYIKKLSDVDGAVLRTLVKSAWDEKAQAGC